MGPKIIKLNENEEYLTLQSLLQIGGVISTGGMAKIYLAENKVMVNGEEENRRGRKLRSGDKIEVPGCSFLIK